MFNVYIYIYYTAKYYTVRLLSRIKYNETIMKVSLFYYIIIMMYYFCYSANLFDL